MIRGGLGDRVSVLRVRGTYLDSHLASPNRLGLLDNNAVMHQAI
jgi:hypothetical protein